MKFSFPQSKMQFKPIFLQVLWQFLSARRSHEQAGAFIAACGGENRPNYFKYRPHFRKAQAIGTRLATLGESARAAREEEGWGEEFRRALASPISPLRDAPFKN